MFASMDFYNTQEEANLYWVMGGVEPKGIMLTPPLHRKQNLLTESPTPIQFPENS